MQNKKVCEIEGCKANLSHREGAHSNWCPNFRIRIYDGNKEYEKVFGAKNASNT